MNISGDNIHTSVAARANAQDLGPHAAATLNAYLALQIIPSHIGLPILTTTFLFSKTIKRHPVMINACLCWILSGIFSVMLLYVGQHTGSEPDKTLCRAQAALLYGVTPMWSVAIFMLVYYVWSCSDCRGIKLNRFATCVMVAAPYFTLGIWSISASVLIMRNRDKISRSRRFFYCSLDHPFFSNAMSLFTALVCILTTIMEICIAVILYRNWRNIREAGRSGNTDIQLIIRILVFGFYIFMGIIFSLMSAWHTPTAVPDMFSATVGFVVMLIFGSQPDLWRLWFFWCFERGSPKSSFSASPEPTYARDQRNLHNKLGVAHIKIEVSHLVV